MKYLFSLLLLVSSFLFYVHLQDENNVREITEESLNKFLIDSSTQKNQADCQSTCEKSAKCRSSVFKPTKDATAKNCFTYSVILSAKRENAMTNFTVYIKIDDKSVKKPSMMNKCSLCPSGWELMFGSCYKSSKQELEYDRAVSYCKNLNSNLAIPKTSQELDYLSKVLEKDKIYFSADNQNFYIWLGGYSDKGSYKNFKWDDGSLIDQNNQLWCDDSPAEKKDFYCIEMGLPYGACLKNFNCTEFLNYTIKSLAICQKNC